MGQVASKSKLYWYDMDDDHDKNYPCENICRHTPLPILVCDEEEGGNHTMKVEIG